MKKFNPIGSTLTLVLVILFAFVLFDAMGKPIQARLFPMMVGGIGLALTLVQLFKEIVALLRWKGEAGSKEDAQQGATDFAITDEEKTRAGKLRAAEQFLWIGALVAALWLVGFHVGVPLVVGLYLYRQRESWLIVLGVSAGIAVVVWGAFDQLLNLPFPPGVLMEMLGLG